MSYPDILLKQGAGNSTAVQELKKQLNLQGFGPLDEANPNFGESTRAAVIRFQKAKLLNPDGEVGPLTWHRLYFERQPIIQLASTLRGIAVEVALTQLYVREKTGKNDGVEVEAYLHAVGLGKGYPYCAAYVYWDFNEAANQLKLSNPLPKTAGVLDFLAKAPKEYRVTDPEKGDIGIMDFGHGKGHMFLVKKREGLKVLTVEGNTSADPTSAIEDRDGQGVFERIRNKSAAKAYLRFP